MKKLLSFLLAALMFSVTTVTAFAEDTNAENTEAGTYSSLEEAKEDVLSWARDYKEYFIFNDGILGYSGYPEWSEHSCDNLNTALNYVKAYINDCTTIEEVVELKKQLDKAVDEMCVESGELEWILNYMKKDYESEGYYDEETTAEIKEIYEQAQSDYASGDENQIHISYINMRNLLNKLCLYNQVAGDVNQDGQFNIDDITLMQKNLACMINFNSSQNYLSYFYKNSSINLITNWQKELIYANNGYIKGINYEISKLSNISELDLNKKYRLFNFSTEQANYLFNNDIYYYRWNPWC